MQKIPIESRIYFRHGIIDFVELINSLKINFMVVSAGIGDIVKYSFEELFEEISSKVQTDIVSNFGQYDNQMLVGFKSPLIHSFNKEQILANTYYEKY